MISKVLVANRGEIAIRAFRAAYELGIATVAVYPYEDRNSPHRLADEAYQIGEVGHPVRAYLSVDEIVATARHAGADAIYPGYGFLICVGDPRKGGSVCHFLGSGLVSARAWGGGPQPESRWTA